MNRNAAHVCFSRASVLLGKKSETGNHGRSRRWVVNLGRRDPKRNGAITAAVVDSFADRSLGMLTAFSLIRNTRDLIKYNGNNDLNIFNGLKVVTMILVLFGHKYLYFVINPLMYGKRLERVSKRQ